MITIMWVIDGVGWGYDNFAKSCSKRLVNYKHEFVSIRNGNPSSAINELGKIKPDIIMCMNPASAAYFCNYSVVSRLGLKIADGIIISRLSSVRMMLKDNQENVN